MCTTYKSIVKISGPIRHVFPLRCKRWTCPDCAPARRKAVIRQAVDGNPNRFITLTPNPAQDLEPDEIALQMTRAWRDVVREFKRLHPQAEAHYMAVFEATKRGFPHMHILWRGAYIDQRWLSKQMRLRTGAPVVWISLIRNKKKAAEYCAKYFSKRPIRFGTTKRYWRSLHYLAESETARKKRLKGNATFYVVDHTWRTMLRYFEQCGAIIYPEKGERGVAVFVYDESGGSGTDVSMEARTLSKV